MSIVLTGDNGYAQAVEINDGITGDDSYAEAIVDLKLDNSPEFAQNVVEAYPLVGDAQIEDSEDMA